MMKSHSIFASKFVRFLAFIICWGILANLVIWLNPPTHQPPDDSFMVCVESFENPRAILLSSLTPDDTLCQKKMADETEQNDIDYTSITPIGNAWELTRYSDRVYRYRIENNQVMPLWYSYKDDNTLRNLSRIWGLLLTFIIFSVAKRISKNKKPN